MAQNPEQVGYHIDHPISADIIIDAQDNKGKQQFCLEALTLAVREQRMPPEKAAAYMKTWFGEEVDFSGIA